MISGYTLTAFPYAFIPQQLQIKQQPTNTAKGPYPNEE